MCTYAFQATLGDDVYSEPTTNFLEAHIAKLTGKEAAVFMPSGTMSNQIALRTHLVQPPYSVLCDYRSHINKYVSASFLMIVSSPQVDTKQEGPPFTLELTPLP